jgi:hypothetical protein
MFEKPSQLSPQQLKKMLHPGIPDVERLPMHDKVN